MRIEEKMIDAACNSGDSIYSDKHFYNGLLLTRMDCDNLFRSRPLYTELYPFVEAGLDVRPWKRYLAQETLRFGDRVLIQYRPHHGQVAVIKTCSPGGAVVLAMREGAVNPELLDVDMRSLDRHFQVGDNVRTIPKTDDESPRYGQVISVAEADIKELKKRKKELRRVINKLKEEDSANKKILAKEMHRLKAAVWGLQTQAQEDGQRAESNCDHTQSRDYGVCSDDETDKQSISSDCDNNSNTPAMHIAPMYDYSFFRVRYVEVTVFDTVRQELVCQVHSFYAGSRYILHPSSLLVMSSLNSMMRRSSQQLSYRTRGFIQTHIQI